MHGFLENLGYSMVVNMPNVKKPSREVLTETIMACFANGLRLKDDSYALEFQQPASLQLYALLIAQEEVAKAFILLLIRDDIIPFNRFILRAINDHACKHLVGIVMDYIVMRWNTMEEAMELIRADVALGDQLPNAVESAISLLRYKKIARWESRAWDWENAPAYDKEAKKIADGKEDRRKQDTLYVRVGGDGRVCPPPPITREEIDQQKERLEGFHHLVETLLEGSQPSYRYEKVILFIRAMFSQQF